RAGWRGLMAEVVEEWSREVGLELPISSTAVATLVANLFQGLEVEILAGVSEAEAPHLEVLEAVARLIEGLEAPPARCPRLTSPYSQPMRVAVAFDHRGVKLRERLLEELDALHHQMVDLGTDTDATRIDYPDKAKELGKAITGGEAERGILVCG